MASYLVVGLLRIQNVPFASSLSPAKELSRAPRAPEHTKLQAAKYFGTLSTHEVLNLKSQLQRLRLQPDACNPYFSQTPATKFLNPKTKKSQILHLNKKTSANPPKPLRSRELANWPVPTCRNSRRKSN